MEREAINPHIIPRMGLPTYLSLLDDTDQYKIDRLMEYKRRLSILEGHDEV